MEIKLSESPIHVFPRRRIRTEYRKRFRARLVTGEGIEAIALNRKSQGPRRTGGLWFFRSSGNRCF